MNNVEQQAWQNAYQRFCASIEGENLQNVFTPYDICHDIISKLHSYSGKFGDRTICVLNLEFAEVLIYDFGVKKENVWFVTDCIDKARFAQSERYKGVHVKLGPFQEFLKGE